MVCDTVAEAVDGIVRACCTGCATRSSTGGVIGVWDGPEYRVRVEPAAEGGCSAGSSLEVASSAHHDRMAFSTLMVGLGTVIITLAVAAWW